MAIKPPELLNRLPSVSELLEKPPIRALVDRWNRSAVMGGVRSFLDEVRTDLERRADELPSIRELAERAARYVVSRQQHSLGITINATGQLFGPSWSGAPMAEPALERTIALGREFAAATSGPNAQSHPELESLLCRLTGAQSATVVHSYPSAVWLSLAALAANREVLISRAEGCTGDDSDTLPNLAAAAQARLKEIGPTSDSATAKFEAAVSAHVAVLLMMGPDSLGSAAENANSSLEGLIASARDRDLISIDALGAAPLIDPPVAITWPRRSAHDSIAAGSDLVLLRGDGFVGGPACGIILGRSELVGRITQHPLFAPLLLDSLRTATLTATVECYDNPSRGADTLPVWQCLGTSIENLQNRAERMAAQLSHAPGIASATAVETRSPHFVGSNRADWPSYGVALSAPDGDVGSLEARMKSAHLPIIGRIEGPQLVLDLRTVLPRQDKTIVDSLLGS